MLLKDLHAHCGFYIGQDGLLAVTPGFCTVTLRLADAHIISALFTDGQVTAAVDGQSGASAALIQAKGGMLKPCRNT